MIKKWLESILTIWNDSNDHKWSKLFKINQMILFEKPKNLIEIIKTIQNSIMKVWLKMRTIIWNDNVIKDDPFAI